MIGTILNIVTVLVGGSIGILFGNRFPERIRQTVIAGLGLFTAAIGFQMFLKTQNPILVLGSLLIGGITGEWLQIETGLQNFGAWIEKHAHFEAKGMDPERIDRRARFVRGFLTASLVFCVGPMTILGSIQDGLTGDYSLLAIKSTLDGFAALAFASILGEGVLFSTLVILLYQGGLSLAAAQLQNLVSGQMMNEMTAVGGVMLIGIAFSSLLEIKQIRVGNFLPALILAPIIAAVLALF
jgi:hypothetical protein